MTDVSLEKLGKVRSSVTGKIFSGIIRERRSDGTATLDFGGLKISGEELPLVPDLDYPERSTDEWGRPT